MAKETWDVKLNLEDKEALRKIKNLKAGVEANLKTNLNSNITNNFTSGLAGGISSQVQAGFKQANPLIAAGIAQGVKTGITQGLLATLGAGGILAALFSSTLKGAFVKSFGANSATLLEMINTLMGGQNKEASFGGLVKNYGLTNLLKTFAALKKLKELEDYRAADPSRGPKLTLDESSAYLSSIRRVMTFGQATKILNSDLKGLSGGLLRVAGAMSRFAAAGGGAAGAITGLAAALVLATPIVANFQRTALGIAEPYLTAAAAVEGLRNKVRFLANDSKATIKATENLAKLPGIDQEGAFTGVAKLLDAGFNDEEGVALAGAFSKVTDNAEKYKLTLQAIGQIINKDVLSSEEIRGQLGDSVNGLNRLLKEEFGTANVEELKNNITPKEFVARLASRANTRERTGSPIQSGLDNITDSINRLKASFGEGLAKYAIPLIETLTAKIDKLVETGKFKEFGERLSQVFNTESMVVMLDTFVNFIDSSTRVAEAVLKIGNAFTWVGDQIWKVINGIGTFINETADKLGMFGKFLAGMGLGGIAGGLINNFLPQINNPKPIVEDPKNKEVLDKLVAETKNSKQSNINTNTGTDIERKQLDALRDIVNNTQPDLTRNILGGGDLGAIGITPEELSTRRSKKSRKAPASVVSHMVDLLDSMYTELDRQNTRLGLR